MGGQSSWAMESEGVKGASEEEEEEEEEMEEEEKIGEEEEVRHAGTSKYVVKYG